jgi:hypothetical protein
MTPGFCVVSVLGDDGTCELWILFLYSMANQSILPKQHKNPCCYVACCSAFGSSSSLPPTRGVCCCRGGILVAVGLGGCNTTI